VRVTDPPEQKVVAPLALMVAVGSGFTVTVVFPDMLEHPLALVTLTLYVPEALTVMSCEV
jgi:hypothetical protein